MREILFRGKRESNGEWVEGYLYPSTGRDKGKWLITVVSLDLNTSNTYAIIPDTVGEFTGLFDRYGNGIFEGDIIEYFGEQFQVIWNKDEATFSIALGNNEYCYFDDLDSNLSAVIGNVYDNPEMQLEKEH